MNLPAASRLSVYAERGCRNISDRQAAAWLKRHSTKKIKTALITFKKSKSILKTTVPRVLPQREIQIV